MAASTDSGIAEGSADPKHDLQEIDREPGGQEIHADANNHWIAAEDGRPVASAREKALAPASPASMPASPRRLRGVDGKAVFDRPSRAGGGFGFGGRAFAEQGRGVARCRERADPLFRFGRSGCRRRFRIGDRPRPLRAPPAGEAGPRGSLGRPQSETPDTGSTSRRPSASPSNAAGPGSGVEAPRVPS